MIFNMTGGGSSAAPMSTIVVTAPTGSTVTCTLDGQVRTAPESGGTWTFLGCPPGLWTIQATLGEESAQTTLTIQEEGQLLRYPVTLVYWVWDGEIFDDGNTFDEYTGGLEFSGSYMTLSGGAITYAPPMGNSGVADQFKASVSTGNYLSIRAGMQVHVEADMYWKNNFYSEPKIQLWLQAEGGALDLVTSFLYRAESSSKAVEETMARTLFQVDIPEKYADRQVKIIITGCVSNKCSYTVNIYDIRLTGGV